MQSFCSRKAALDLMTYLKYLHTFTELRPIPVWLLSKETCRDPWEIQTHGNHQISQTSSGADLGGLHYFGYILLLS